MSKARILVVEDEQIVALDIQGTLESCGYTIIGRTNRGDDAIKKASDLLPDLVMMDIGLKGEMDGIEAAKQIRAQFDLPVIFLTAFANQSTIERAREAEPYGYVLKPFEERELVSNIEMALYKHNMEHKLRESENKFRNVIENSSDGIMLVDSQGILIEWNAAAEEISGLKRSTVIGQAISEVIFRMLPVEKRLPVFLETFRHQWDAIIKNEYSCGLDRMRETEIETPQGVRKIVQNNGFAITLPKGTLAGSIMRDITEQKKAELEILEARNQLKATLDAIPDLLFEVGLDGRYYSLHSPQQDLLFAPPDFLLGKTITEVLPNDAARIVMQALQEAHEKGRSNGRQYELQFPHGRHWFELSISRKNVDPGREPRFIVLARDITDRKTLELAERDQRQLAEALRDTAMTLNSTLQLDDVLDRILANVGKLVTYDMAMVLLIEEGSVRKIRYQNNIKNPLTQPIIGDIQANLINVPILKTMLKTRKPLLIPDIQKDARWHILKVPGMQRIRSFICAPIEIREKVVGLINIISFTPDSFTSLHTERIMAFATQAAIAFDNARLFEQTQQLSLTDHLTELFNMRYFLNFARHEFERIQRYRRTLSIAMLDIDHFKNINDTFGHNMGDQALHEIAARIKNSVRVVDVVARFGGEEFVVLMPETGLDEACQVAERVRQSVADRPIENNDAVISITLSLGVAEMGKNTKSLDELIKYADMALYKAKASGRNRVESYSKDI